MQDPLIKSPADNPDGTALDELAFRRQEALKMGGEDRVTRQHSMDRLTIRERIAALSDADSFQELGSLTGAGSYDDANRLKAVTPAPYVSGVIRIEGRPVAVGGEDFTVRGGTTFSAPRRKGGQGGLVEDIAFHYRMPLVNLVDGAGGSVGSLEKRGHTVFPGVHGFERSCELLGCVPVVSAVLGTAAGGPAGRAILSHFSVMIDGGSQVFAAGPPVVKRSLGQDLHKEDLGGAKIAVAKAGTIHNAARDETDAFAQIVKFLSFMPQNVWELPPVTQTDDPISRADEELALIIPKERRRAYDMRKLIEHVVDRDSSFEIQPTHGKAVVIQLARIAGRPIGIIANNPMHYGGAMDANAARKQVRFMKLCDTFHIPVLFLVDVPGFMVGLKAEEDSTLLEGMRAVHAAAQMSVPTFTLVIRKCYGMAGMATCNKNDIDLKMAWPSAEWGSLPIEGGVAAAFRREIAEADDPKAREKELEERLKPFASPFRTAEAFAVEEIIDPRETRRVIGNWLELAQARLAIDCGPKTGLSYAP